MGELELVEKCLRNDAVAQRTLFETYAPKMLAVCMRYAKDKPQAEDVLQIGFIKVFSNLERFSGKGSLEGWIRRIMVNASLDEIRKNAKFLANQSVDDVDYKLGVTQNVDANLLEEDLMKLVQNLPVGYQTVFNLYAIEGFSHKEIAEKLGVTESTSKSQYSRAKKLLQQAVEELGIGR